ncbi:trypsin-like serine peptidase [Streptomyces sclerotialus]|uniref:trypsin-like serine peptidase n=1 Tax=Streptomyces sclerotialus TaxID=1957 RepID=UPI0004C9175B
MRSIRPSAARPRAGRRTTRGMRPAVAAAALVGALALTATACGPSEDDAGSQPDQTAVDQPGGGKLKIPQELQDKLKDLGVNLDDWKHGEWKNWDKDKWLREAGQFVNPYIKGLWDPDRMKDAEQPDKHVEPEDISGDQGVTDPEPAPVTAQPVSAPYSTDAPGVGKVFFDSPEGSMVCSGAVVEDPANPGKSNMVWTAGHCVHAGKSGGWYRNIAFVPSYNDSGKSAAELQGATKEQLAPKGVFWADAAQTSQQWIDEGAKSGGQGAPYDFAVLHVKPEAGNTKSLEETVGTAYPVQFNAPAVPKIPSMTAQGYPAVKPFDGQTMQECPSKPGRLSLDAAQPTMYRIGCTMTAGSSGGPWFAKDQQGRTALVSNTSIGPVTADWLAGPHLGAEAKGVYEAVSKKFANQ